MHTGTLTIGPERPLFPASGGAEGVLMILNEHIGRGGDHLCQADGAGAEVLDKKQSVVESTL